ncbi:mechanosensitive ion channel domain-containing protein [Stutzerimonas nitrititolerans]|uniref:mechanosensitive ion channel domain-containing protein n=2 Tax=Stutzerimonas nitrititolerans TaxID=2482751 RepID=UPI002897A3AA|nr:mechanosensitive ion channel domain-containing protein [Stutzerimonas nitrititolerans]
MFRLLLFRGAGCYTFKSAGGINGGAKVVAGKFCLMQSGEMCALPETQCFQRCPMRNGHQVPLNSAPRFSLPQGLIRLMHRSRSSILCIPLIAVLLQMAAPVQAQSESSHLSGDVSRQDARRAVEVLEDEGRRADVLATLRVIAGDAAVAPAADDTEGEPAPAEAPVAAEPEPVITPLEEGGLIARMLGQVGRWADGLGQQVGQVRDALLEIPAWFDSIFRSQAERALLVDALIALAVVFVLGLLVEWALRRLLRRPCLALQEHARQVEERARVAEVVEGSLPGQQQTGQIDAERAAVAAATQPEQPGVALVQTIRDGVERVEAIPINAPEQNVAEPDRSAVAEPAPTERKAKAKARRDGRVSEHRGALRHLPFALGIFLLDLLPLALFFCVAALVMHLYPSLDERTREAAGVFVLAYLFTRLSMAVVRLLISPSGYGLRVFRLSGETSRLLNHWALYFVALAAFGIAVADALQTLGGGAAGRTAILKFVSLLAHLMIVMLIFRLRRPVRDAIAPKAGSSGPLATLRHWAAQIWAIAAAVFVMGMWVVWALGVENGFPRLIEFIGVTGGIVVLGRLAAVLLLGALERGFVGGPGDESDAAQAADGVRSRLAEQLYPLVRWLMSVLIAVCVLVALFQAWGFDAIGWFAAGTIGRSLASAAITIVVAVILALVVWQLSNAVLERRIARWSESGELMRAARLRTLLPMLRTGLMIVILLIVGMTALSEIGINTTPLLAGASIIGVALGFGSQKLVQDFITGIFLLMENAMQVGDWVTVAGVSGTVENLSIRTVRLRAGDGSLHIVPFSSVSTVNNTNRGIGNAAVRISVGYDTDIDQAIAELKKIGAELRADPAFADLIIDDLAVWGVDSVDGSMVTLAGQMRCVDKGRWGVQREFNRRIFEHFRELGIQIADPRERFMMAQEPMA